MKRRHLPGFFSAAIVTLLVTACGGGGGGGGGGVLGGGTGTTADTPTLTLSIIDGAGNPASNVNGNVPVTLRAVLQDSGGSAIVGQVVTFTTEVGVLTPVTGNVLTIAGGIADISLGAGTVADAGTATATATVAGVTVTSDPVGIQSDGLGTATGSPTLSVSAVTLTTNTISRAVEATGSVTVTDTTGSPISGAIVQFSTVGGGILNPTAGAIITDTSGIATITLLAGVTATTGSLGAVISFNSESVTATSAPFVTAGDGVATIELSISGTPPTSLSSARAAVVNGAVIISNASAETIVATVLDERNNAVQGTIVTFTNTGQGVLSAATDITNASGQASTNLLAGTIAGFGEISATTTLAGQALTTANDASISFTTAGDGPFNGIGTSNLGINIILVDGNGVAITGAIDANNPGVLQATVVDALGAALEGIVVEFATNGIADIFPISGLALTNSSGIATVALNAGSVPGAGLATATILISGGRFDSDTLTFETLGNAGDTVIVVTLTFTDATPGNGTNIITVSDSATIGILVEDNAGNNLPNRTASITTSLGSVSVVGGTAAQTITAISDADGRISVSLTAGATFGTGDLVVTVGDTTETVQFDVGVAGLQIGICSGGASALDCSGSATFTAGGIDISTSPLSAGGTSSVGLVVVDAVGTPVPDIDIAFSTNFSTTLDATTGLPLASISANLTSNSLGVVSGTYQASGGEGPDIITATESSTGATATGTIEVLAANIGAIVFDSVTDPTGTDITNIFIKESGGNSTAFIVFQVLDVLGQPAEGQNVQFSLASTVGAITLQNADSVTGISSGLTGPDGKATAIVEAGFIATTISVQASLDVDTDDDGDVTDDPGSDTLVTLSGSLAVNTGSADQNSMTLAATQLNFEGLISDGETVTLTVFLADSFNNPVPDGTSVAFRTEFGTIVPSCNTTGGSCTTTLTSTEPRSPLDPNVSLRSLGVSGCPSALIFEENVTIAGGAGNTLYQVSSVNRVETTADVLLTAGATNDYTVDSDGSGITCVSGSCTGTLKITYTRAALDEDNNGTTTHVATDPGQATAPFRTSLQGVTPCSASASAQGGTLFSGYNGGLGQLFGGRSTILAFTQGEESFIDSNGNGLYDFNEPFVDLTEAFLDHNEDNVFGNGDVSVDDSRDRTSRDCYGPNSPITNPIETLGKCYQVGGDEEEPIDFNVNAQFDGGNGIYNGTSCPKDISDRTDTCDNSTDPCDEGTEQFCTRQQVHIRREAFIIFSGSFANFSLEDASSGEFINSVDLTGTTVASGMVEANVAVTANDGSNITSGTDFTVGHADSQVAPQIGDTVSLVSGSSGVVVGFADVFNAVLPASASVSVAAGVGGCLITNSPGGTQGSTNTTGVSGIFISLSPDDSITGGGSAPITVTITTPNAAISTLSFTCTF